MQKVKKYLALTLLLMVFPFVAFIGTHFILESNRTIYNFIPQESDLVIEINTRNFINEIMYQRIYEEAYFHEKIVRDEHAEPIKEIGLDLFSSIVIFREQWSESNIWMGLVGYTDESKLKSFLNEQIPDAHYCFGDTYALIQLTPYPEEEKIQAHMQSIMNGEIESFKQRVNLSQIFDRKKEINFYISPQNSSTKNQLLNGYLSLDFLDDKIAISGQFTPISGFSDNAPVAYALDENAPFSLRSSLDIFRSVHWFSMDNIKGLPEYSQMAVDYRGMNLFMVHKDLGYVIPFKQYPDLQAHFDIINYQDWKSFFNEMQEKNIFIADTVAHILHTNMGTYFNYNFDQKTFELLRNESKLTPSNESDLYFAFQLNILKILENIKLGVDVENPPSEILQTFGLNMVEGQLEELKVMSNIESVRFELRLEDETKMSAEGNIQLVNKSGNSIIESVSFGSAAILFAADYISGAETNP